ncbi:MAG: PEP-CTERM sorting domain-containing protein [Verrucomicrobia bacterium]|nr:PEP-CTERM sorting domain-containing protein [Verrucomicrobiota bacterium]
MRSFVATAVILLLLLACSAAQAYTFTPPDPDIGDLAHQYYYVWGIEVTWDVNPDPIYEWVNGASLFIHSIWNWDNAPNDLWIHLLDDAPIGLTTGYDDQDGVDQFLVEGILLVHYQDLSMTPQDLWYFFTAEQRDTLNAYAADGVFAIAFDPDCHFYNCGISLDVGTERIEIPEPGTLTLIGLGLAALGLIRLRKG